MTRTTTAALIAAGLLTLAGCSASGAGTATTSSAPEGAGEASEQTTANAELVTDFVTQAFVDRDYRAAAERYLDDDYIQHSPAVPGGADGFVEGIGSYLDSVPELRVDIARVVAEGELVLVQSHMVPGPGARGSAVMDIFRVSDGRIAEHWDAVQEVPEDSANGHTMVDGTTERTATTDEQRERNRSNALAFLDTAFNDAEFAAAVDRYVGEPYIQHNPLVADGGDAFVEAFAGATPSSGEDATVFPRTIAQDDLVAVQTFTPSGTGMAGSGSIDIFRFDADGLIVEHWDAVQEYPAETASGLTVWDDER
ncbi:nuclear transport factor 2 family protein [Mycetocola reblochoni]|uniref:Possible membrane protein n=2 Tax=Mycetocola reblochoni TaxID=331618 RepID=A0A1R4KB37_9MICO|nr:nuclear transport factor 2 family protein [Mycetocola reblochoni]RLP69235.1 hypothetical protein D9V30_07935 [Mycetocola reblochoni]SJN41526.1 Possible membrane protein [Mycetocola reblochoni REB411]